MHMYLPFFWTKSSIPVKRGCSEASSDWLTINDNWTAILWDWRWSSRRGNKPNITSATSDGTAQVTQSPTNNREASSRTLSLQDQKRIITACKSSLIDLEFAHHNVHKIVLHSPLLWFLVQKFKHFFQKLINGKIIYKPLITK